MKMLKKATDRGWVSVVFFVCVCFSFSDFASFKNVLVSSGSAELFPSVLAADCWCRFRTFAGDGLLASVHKVQPGDTWCI